MNIKQIKLTNFLSHVDSSLTFEDGLPYLFIGENGAGKSSLVKDSITWALFAEARAKGAGDDLIYNNEDSCKVEITFEVNKETYRVVRERERNKKTKLTVHKIINGILTDISNATVSRTQEDLEKILGFNYLVFSVSACLEQNSKLNFSDLTPKEAKETVMKVLNIDKFSDYEKAVKEKLNKLETDLRIELSLLQQNQDRLKQYANSKDNLSSLKTDKEKLLTKKYDLENDFSLKKLAYEFCITGLQDTIEKNQKRVEELRAEYRTRETKVMEIGQQLALSGSEINRIQQRIVKINGLGSKCPECESTLEHSHVAGILEGYVADLNSNKKLQEEKKPIFETLKHEMEQIEKDGKQLGVLEKQAELKKQTGELTNLRDKKDYELDRLNIGMSDVDKTIARLENEVTNLDELTALIEKGEQKISDLKIVVSQYTVLHDAFGKNGIPAMLISNVTAELEFNINQILRELTNKNISVKVVTEKNLKIKGELADTMEVIVRNGLFERPYHLYSGGEKYRIDLAIRLALSKLLCNRNNFKLETLIIDEPAGLDRAGLISFKETISNLSRLFKKIFVISHLSELIESTEDKFKLVRVVSDSGVSYVR